MKKISLFYFIMSIFSIGSMAATLSLSERHGPSGSEIQVPVNFTDINDLTGAEILIQYDNTLLEFINVSLSSFTEEFIITSQNNGDELALSMANATGISQNNGVLVYMNFRIRVSAQVGTSTELTILAYNLYNSTGEIIDTEVKHGLVKISEIIVYPNPITPNNDGFNDYANFVVPDSLAGEVVVRLYSISGKEVTILKEAASSTLLWDGTDRNGQKLRPGPYLYLMKANGKTLAKGSITIMR